MQRWGVGLVTAWWVGCAAPECPLPDEAAVADPEQPNILIVLIDDAGIDQYGPWGVAADPVPAPTMDCLCEAGMRFDTVWASPFCTPARAALYTGLHPRREGIGRFVNVDTDEWELPLHYTTLAEALAQQGYHTAFYGKWHIGSKGAPSKGAHPNLQGFEHYAGTLGNIKKPRGTSRRAGYRSWEHLENGTFSARRGYLTTRTVDDALDGLDDLPEPWFVVLSFNGAHEPLHRPPGRLVEGRVRRNADDADLYRAMVESVDTEMGRFFETIEPEVLGRTQIWTMSDNGTVPVGRPPEEPQNRAKGTVYEGGVRIPLVVTGAGVPRGESSDALVSILDVYPTIVEGLGTSLGEVDGKSLWPLFEDPSREHHDVLYADVTEANGDIRRAVRNRNHKLVQSPDGTVQSWRVYDGLDEEPVPIPLPELERALFDFVDAYEPDATDE